MHVSDEYSELGQELKNGLVIDPPGFVKNSKTMINTILILEDIH